MARKTMQFTLHEAVSMEEAKGTLALARMAVESLYGRDRVELEAAAHFDDAARQISFEVSRQVGRALALVFAGYARREFGADAVHVEHRGADSKVGVT
jgi:hypothetical protein